jgi:hypothetical protein
MSDHKGARLILDALPPAKALLADRGYDSNWFREAPAKSAAAAGQLGRTAKTFGPPLKTNRRRRAL